MKKIIWLLVLMTLCTSAFGRWENKVLAVYKFENNALDATTHGHNLTTVGTGGAFQTDIVKRGTYSYSVINNGHRFNLPASLITAMSALTRLSIQWWQYHTSVSGVHRPMLSSNNWDTAPLVLSMREGNWFESRGTGWGGTNGVVQTNNTWIFCSAEWRAEGVNQFKVYENGDLKLTFTSITTNPFTGITTAMLGNHPDYGGLFNASARYDQLIFTSELENGVEVLELDPYINVIYTNDLKYSGTESYGQ